MCSDRIAIVILALVLAVSCGGGRRISLIRSGEGPSASISIPDDDSSSDSGSTESEEEIEKDTLPELDPLIMRAIKDDVTGEMVATDVIRASKVTARFRHIAERFGKIFLEFDISVPAGMMDSRWQLRFTPEMRMMGDTVALEPVYITGARYRGAQLRGYQRYDAFLRSIITDSLDFIRLGQLEIFLERNFPETYAMKNDTSIISEPDAASYFGVTQREALEHYRRTLLYSRNERRKDASDRMFRKYVKDPISGSGIRLDTVIATPSGDFVYRYGQSVQSRKGLRKISVSLGGAVYGEGRLLCAMPAPDSLDFYVSSLSTLADRIDRYRFRVVERRVYDRTLALIDFRQGRSEIDTTLGDNASEMRRILQCVEEISSREEFEPDSIVVSASCSPEGSWSSNARLSQKRSAAVKAALAGCGSGDDWKLVARSEPENWRALDVLVVNDTTLSEPSREGILSIIRSAMDRDAAERKLSSRTEYRYLREKLYPRLRTVQLEFHLHRKGMQKDTIHTTELDTVYAAGVEALRNLDYRKAVELLRPYRDYNSALALFAASYNYSALDLLEKLPEDSKTLYLKALVLARLGRVREAVGCYDRCVEQDRSFVHRANLDPEISELVKKYRSQ